MKPKRDRSEKLRAAQTGVTVTPSVRVTFDGRYQVDGGPWQPVPQPVVVQGPLTNLRIMQARAQLVAGND